MHLCTIDRKSDVGAVRLCSRPVKVPQACTGIECIAGSLGGGHRLWPTDSSVRVTCHATDPIVRAIGGSQMGAILQCAEPALGKDEVTTFHLDHPHTGDTQVLGGWGYIWGALLGPLYLLIKGFPSLALLMIPITMLIMVSGAATIATVALVSEGAAIRTVATFTLILLTFSVHGYAAVQLLRRGFLGLGYREGYY
jgi:hypothetical protein